MQPGVNIITQILSNDDPYKILGVSKNSSPSEIKSAFKKLSLVVHPDKCKHKEAANAFAKLKNAYDLIKHGNYNYDYTMPKPKPPPKEKTKEEKARDILRNFMKEKGYI